MRLSNTAEGNSKPPCLYALHSWDGYLQCTYQQRLWVRFVAAFWETEFGWYADDVVLFLNQPHRVATYGDAGSLCLFGNVLGLKASLQRCCADTYQL